MGHWICVATGLLSGAAAAWAAAGGIGVLLAVLGGWRHGGFARTAIVGFGGAAMAMFVLNAEWSAAAAALRNASVLLAFLACLYLLRSLVESAPRLAQVQAGFDGLDLRQKRGAVQLLAWVFALPLAIGALSVVVPLVRREGTPEIRLDLAAWSMRGLFLNVLYSPFTIAMAVVTSILIGLDLPILITSGFALSVLLLISGHLFGLCRLPRRLPPHFWSAFAAVIAPVFLLAAITTAIIVLTSFSPAQVGLLIIPVFVSGVAFLGGVRKGLTMLARTSEDLRNYDSEAAVFLSALLFAGAIQSTPQVSETVQWLFEGVGPSQLIVITAVAISTSTIIGLHMVVSTSILLGLFAPAMPDTVHTTLLGLGALSGWAFGAMCGIGSVSFLTCAKSFDVSALGLALGTNLRFVVLAFFLLGTAVLVLT